MLNYIKFFACLPLWCFGLFFEWLNQLLMKATGGAPNLQKLSVIRHFWKECRGIKPVSVELTNVNGYIYNEYTYEDGSKLLFRD